MTQGELARGGFSVSYISAVERGQVRPSLSLLEWCAERLDVPLRDLLPESSYSSEEEANARQRTAQTGYELLRARVALAAGRVDEAGGLINDLLRRLDDRAPPGLLWYSAYASAALGDFGAARVRAERYAQQAGESGDGRLLAAASLLFGFLHARSQEPMRALEAFREALKRAEDSNVDLDLLRSASGALAQELAERPDPHEAWEALTQALHAYERFADPVTLAEDAERYARQAAASGDYVLAASMEMWAWMARHMINAHRSAAAAYLRRALLANGSVPAPDRERDLLRARDLAMLTRWRSMQTLTTACLVIIQAQDSLVEHASEPQRVLQTAMDLSLAGTEHTGDPFVERGIIAIARAWVALLERDSASAGRYAREGEVALHGSEEGRQERAFAYEALYKIYELMGDGLKALEMLRHALELRRHPPRP